LLTRQSNADKKISQYLINKFGQLTTTAKIMELIIFMAKIIHGEVILSQMWTYEKLGIKWTCLFSAN